ncbi:DUF2513 domain-containing protein [Liquorilactobacillus hordei]|uniref:DUF2513 domain-containing protein n=1 Tax=Liquorilactobacillus hordei TaxID=468911 RepID=A0A3S6QTF9_9LACO|nr:DUF2513 domain-containing protein [Liquorilactobacillus hordei]AUJ29597.1 hypothetical protein BSQ49_04920 [Liquorilactobacillus hordei]
MKLNNECVRELLLYLEKLPSKTAQLPFAKIQIDGFSEDEIKFTGSILVKSGFVEGVSATSLEDTIPNYIFQSITLKGYNFLNNIRSPEVWSKTKVALSHLENVSIDIISTVSSKVLNHLIDKGMGY